MDRIEALETQVHTLNDQLSGVPSQALTQPSLCFTSENNHLVNDSQESEVDCSGQTTCCSLKDKEILEFLDGSGIWHLDECSQCTKD
jgi:serine O-acetyltransferase